MQGQRNLEVQMRMEQRDRLTHLRQHRERGVDQRRIELAEDKENVGYVALNNRGYLADLIGTLIHVL